MLSFRFGVLVAALFVVPFVAAPASADVTDRGASAPADEYFGPLHLSVLGMTNTLRLATIRERADVAVDAFDAIATVERSVRDWEQRYPRDPWLARTVLSLRRAYEASSDAAAREKVAAIDSWLFARYPASAEADLVRTEDAPQRTIDPVEALYVPPAPAAPPARFCPSYATCR